MLATVQAMIGKKFAPLNIMYNEDADMDSMVTTFNTAVAETASEFPGKYQKKKSWDLWGEVRPIFLHDTAAHDTASP